MVSAKGCFSVASWKYCWLLHSLAFQGNYIIINTFSKHLLNIDYIPETILFSEGQGHTDAVW